MKITTYSVNGSRSYGIVTEEGIIDAKPLAGGPQTLRGAIAAGALDIIAEAAAGKTPTTAWTRLSSSQS